MKWAQQDVPDREWAAYLRVADAVSTCEADIVAYNLVIEYEVACEREACAAVCQTEAETFEAEARDAKEYHLFRTAIECNEKAATARLCAEAIRARKP